MPSEPAHKAHLLTRWEVQEFIDELIVRPKLWTGHRLVWVRQRYGENQFAIAFQDGLPNDMFVLHVKSLHEGETDVAALRYVEWLLDKFTSYGHRMRVANVLQSEFCVYAKEKIDRIACALCDPEPSSTDAAAPAPPPTAPPPSLSDTMRAQVTTQRSRALRNLLKKE